MTLTSAPAALSGTYAIGADMPVNRLGFGTMQLTGPGHWDHPADMPGAKAVLRRAIELGINHLDTADAYGPQVVEHLIRKALHPYPDDLVIATKGGLTRQGPNRWAPVGRPEYLRQCVEMSLRRLAVERIDLYYLHRVDPAVPLADQLGALTDLQTEGKIRHLGLSKVNEATLRAAQTVATIAAVQNRHTMLDDDPVLRVCEQEGIAYVPYAPLGAGTLARRDAGASTSPTAAQRAIAALLDRSPVMLPIPGTSSLRHLTENTHAAAHTIC